LESLDGILFLFIGIPWGADVDSDTLTTENIHRLEPGTITFDRSGPDGGIGRVEWRITAAQNHGVGSAQIIGAFPKTEAPTRTRRPSEIGYNLIALETTDSDADFKRLKSLGIPLETTIVEVQDGRAFYFRDLDGNLLALMEFVPGSKLSLKSIRSY
jgi:hypothetical protein